MGVPKVIINFHVMSIINQLFSGSPMYGNPHMYNDGFSGTPISKQTNSHEQVDVS